MDKVIKVALIDSGLRQWQLAELLGMNESVLSRKLRHDLPEDERQHILEIIEKHRKKVAI